ncbi:MAG: AAA family ATPase, partial [Chloroflexota bacterium]|nr:AAA family ATPase [Chloroflexota bacterium]
MTTPLVGRRRELEQAGALLERAFAGAAAGLMLEGEPGIGKTRLLDEVVALGQAAGFATHRAGARELDRQRPFGVIADAIGAERDSPDPDLARIAELLSAGGAEAGASGAARGPELAFQLIELIVDLLGGVSAEGPVLLALDDLQWSDPSSLALLARVLRRLPDAPLALVLACRAEPRSGELEQLLDGLSGAGHPVLRLGPLEEQDVAELVEQALGRQAGEDLLSRLSGARGNPFLVRELVVALRDGDPAQAPLPASLREAVLRRMRSLPRDELELLRAASILGSAFAASDLAAIARQGVAGLFFYLIGELR